MKEVKSSVIDKVFVKYQNNITVYEEAEYIEDYKGIVYRLLKSAMYKNCILRGISEKKFSQIIEYCDMVILFKKLPKVIRESMKMILEDYKYLYMTKNIDYFFSKDEELNNTYVYLDDIKEDVKRSLSKEHINKEELMTVIKIAKNSENVLDENLEKMFVSLLK